MRSLATDLITLFLPLIDWLLCGKNGDSVNDECILLSYFGAYEWFDYVYDDGKIKSKMKGKTASFLFSKEKLLRKILYHVNALRAATAPAKYTHKTWISTVTFLRGCNILFNLAPMPASYASCIHVLHRKMLLDV